MIKNILTALSPCGKLADKVSVLEKQNEDLKQQLLNKQDHINETNKYWKKKMHEIKRKVKHVPVQTFSL